MTTRVERHPLLGRSRVAAAVRVVATLVLTVLAGLVALALAPQAAGLSAHVVTSGSMAPRVNPGDVVLTQQAVAGELRVGQVLLIADPQRAGGLLLHRLVGFDAAGDLVTRGDANRSDDSVHESPSAVRGVARLRVPWVGLPSVWRAQGRLGLIGLVATALASAAAFVYLARERTFPASGSRPGTAPPMTAARRPAVARDLAGTSAVHRPDVVGHTTALRVTAVTEEKRGRATSTGYSLPPVPPPARRTGPARAGSARAAGTARPAGRRHRSVGDHAGCFDGGRLCGQPRL